MQSFVQKVSSVSVVPEGIEDLDWGGINLEFEHKCRHGKHPRRLFCWEGKHTSRRFLGCPLKVISPLTLIALTLNIGEFLYFTLIVLTFLCDRRNPTVADL